MADLLPDQIAIVGDGGCEDAVCPPKSGVELLAETRLSVPL